MINSGTSSVSVISMSSRARDDGSAQCKSSQTITRGLLRARMRTYALKAFSICERTPCGVTPSKLGATNAAGRSSSRASIRYTVDAFSPSRCAVTLARRASSISSNLALPCSPIKPSRSWRAKKKLVCILYESALPSVQTTVAQFVWRNSAMRRLLPIPASPSMAKRAPLPLPSRSAATALCKRNCSWLRPTKCERAPGKPRCAPGVAVAAINR